MGSQSSNNRIAKNTILLYLRSIIVMVISVYSSRVLLHTLGVEDFGLYNIVGGVVAMFSSLKSVLASAVQRFLNFEKGNGNHILVQKIFNMSVVIHMGIAVIFGIVVELFGCWYIQNYLVLPLDNLSTALFVFHCSVIATMIAIYTIPYDAVIIANEKMDFYAFQSIGEIFLKLSVIFILPILPFERIKSYAILILIIALIIRTVSVVYSKRFPECRKVLYWDKSIFKELITFAGWNFFGCVSYSLTEEGANLLLNSFGGVVANAARGLAYQIRSAIMTLANNVLVASQPYVVQQAAIIDKQRFWEYIFLQSRVMFYIMMITGLPIFIFTREIIHIWLNEIPMYTIEFVRSIIIYVIVMSFQKSLDLSFKAYNKMAIYQIVDAGLLLLTLPAIYLVLSFNFPLYYTFIVFSIVRIVDYVAVLIVAKYQLDLHLFSFIRKVFYPAFKGSVMFLFLFLLFHKLNIVIDGFFQLFLAMVGVVILALILLYVVCLNVQEKNIINKNIVKLLNRYYE